MAKIRFEKIPPKGMKGENGTVLFVPESERIYAAIGPDEKGEATLTVTIAKDRTDLDLQLITKGITAWEVLDVMEALDPDLKDERDIPQETKPIVIDNGRIRSIVM